MNEDQRLAAGLKVGISNHVASAALAVLGGGLGLFTYISQSFAPPSSFYALMGAAAAMLVASIWAGGDGAARTVSAIAGGSWSDKSLPQFNWQALLTLLALIVLIVATAIGVSSAKVSAGTDRRVERVEKQLTTLSSTVTDLRRGQTQLRQRLRRGATPTP